jgi:flagellum-specific peptidoglycan hydrolase FlgJ
VFDHNPEEYYKLLISGRKKYATDPNYATKLDNLYKEV